MTAEKQYRYVCQAEGCGFVTDTRTDLSEDCCPDCGEEVTPEEGGVQVYQVTVGYYALHAAEVRVKTRPDTALESVCDIAIARANNDSGAWRSTDHVTDTFVDIIEVGERIDRRSCSDDLPTLDVPLEATDAHVLMNAETRAKLERHDVLVDLCKRFSDIVGGNLAVEFNSLMQ